MNRRSARCCFRSFALASFCAALVFSYNNAVTAAESPQTESNPTGPETMYPLTFSKFLVRQIGKIDVWQLTEGFGLKILEVLRSRGYNVVGAENLLFGVEKSNQARMILGGTLTDFKCELDRLKGAQVCYLTLNWELFDIRKEAVVYKVTTRSQGYLRKEQAFKPEHAAELILRALDSLMLKDRFNAVLAKETVPAPPSEHTKTTYKACTAAPLSLPNDLSNLLEATVVIHPTELGTGSGFFISADGLILTAAHVVEDRTTVRVETKAGFTLNATVLRRNKDKDAALLQVDGHDLPCLNGAPALPPVGTDLYAVGAPLGDALKFSVSKGIVSGIRNIDGCDYIQTDTGLNPGNSGGPLVDGTGQVVGIVAWKHRAGEALAFAVPIQTAVEALGLTAGTETEIAVKEVSLPKREGPVVDIPDPIPQDPKETFKAFSNALRPAHQRMQGGSVLLVFGNLALFSGIITAAVTQTTAGVAVGTSLAALGLAGFIGGVALVASGKREQRKLLRNRRAPLLSVGPLPDLRGGTALVSMPF